MKFLLIYLFLIAASLNLIAQSSEGFYSDDSSSYLIKTIAFDSTIEYKSYQNNILINHSIEKNKVLLARTFFANGKLETERYAFIRESLEGIDYIPFNYSIKYYENGDTARYERYNTVIDFAEVEIEYQEIPNFYINIQINSSGLRMSRRQYQSFEKGNYPNDPIGWQYDYYIDGQLHTRIFYDVPNKKIQKVGVNLNGDLTKMFIQESFFESGVLKYRFEITTDTVSEITYFESGQERYVSTSTLKYFLKNGNWEESYHEYDEQGNIIK